MQGFIRGRVRVSVEGAGLSRFINMAGRAGVSIEEIDKASPRRMTMTVSVADFFKLRAGAKAAQCSLRITGKRGLPFVRSALRFRPFMLIGILSVAALIVFLSGRVWAISVDGCEASDPAAIRSIVEAHGIAFGGSNRRMDTEGAIYEILRSMPEVSWVGIRAEGVHVRVLVKETDAPPIVIDRDEPCDIVASQDAVIESIVVLDGIARVKPGDTVYKGQILIEGLAVRTGGLQRVHALGDVVGRTEVSAHADAPVFTTARTPTGRVETRRLVETPLGEFPAAWEPPFERYDTAVSYLMATDRFLPVRIKYESCYEITEALKPRDELEIKTETALKSLELAEELVDKSASVVDKRLDFVHIDNTALRAVCTLVLLSPIGESVKAY